jgi:hypothetical protein
VQQSLGGRNFNAFAAKKKYPPKSGSTLGDKRGGGDVPGSDNVELKPASKHAPNVAAS